eukprot:2172369-Rhodomonas_salina.1
MTGIVGRAQQYAAHTCPASSLLPCFNVDPATSTGSPPAFPSRCAALPGPVRSRPAPHRAQHRACFSPRWGVPSSYVGGFDAAGRRGSSRHPPAVVPSSLPCSWLCLLLPLHMGIQIH